MFVLCDVVWWILSSNCRWSKLIASVKAGCSQLQGCLACPCRWLPMLCTQKPELLAWKLWSGHLPAWADAALAPSEVIWALPQSHQCFVAADKYIVDEGWQTLPCLIRCLSEQYSWENSTCKEECTWISVTLVCTLVFLLPRESFVVVRVLTVLGEGLLNKRSEPWIIKPENPQDLEKGAQCIYVGLHSHHFRNAKLYFINHFFPLFTLSLPASLRGCHQVWSANNLSMQQCTFLCVRGPWGMLCVHEAYLGKYLGFADLMGIEVCFLSHGNHQFLSTSSVQITVFYMETHFCGEIAKKQKMTNRTAVHLGKICVLP